MTEKHLVTSHTDLQPGDQISWTRFLTFDHHALVKEVTGENEITVYEFTVRDNDDEQSVLKTCKKESTVSIFDGYDPVYKIVHYPQEDPQLLLEAAARN